MVPHYEKVERASQVIGTTYNLPNYPEAIYEAGPGPDLTPAEKEFNKTIMARWPNRQILLSGGMYQKPNDNGNPWPGRSSLGTTMAIALATGRVTIAPNLAVHQVKFDAISKRASGVSAINCA